MTYLDATAHAIKERVDASAIPENAESLFLLYALLVRVKGTATTSADVHDAWTAWMEIRGEHHASMVPYADLPDDVRAQDDAFVMAIHLASVDGSLTGAE